MRRLACHIGPPRPPSFLLRLRSVSRIATSPREPFPQARLPPDRAQLESLRPVCVFPPPPPPPEPPPPRPPPPPDLSSIRCCSLLCLLEGRRSNLPSPRGRPPAVPPAKVLAMAPPVRELLPPPRCPTRSRLMMMKGVREFEHRGSGKTCGKSICRRRVLGWLKTYRPSLTCPCCRPPCHSPSSSSNLPPPATQTRETPASEPCASGSRDDA